MDYSQFIETGHKLFTHGLLTASSGNLSIRSGDDLVITRTGSELGNLSENDMVETGIFADDENSKPASSELPVHREIYKVTSAKAIVHAHPQYSTALTLDEREIIPKSGRVFGVTGNVPVIGDSIEIIPGAFSDEIAGALKDHCIVMVYGHGSFAVGQTMDEACGYTLVFEEYCRENCEVDISRLKAEG